MNRLKQELKGLISQGKSQEAINQLLVISGQLKNNSFSEEVILLSSRLRSYQQAERLNTTNPEELNRSFNSLNKSVLQLIQFLNDDASALLPSYENKNSLTHSKQQKLPKWVIGLVILTGLLFAVFKFGSFNKSGETPITGSLTASLHGIGGKNDIILENNGYLFFYHMGKKWKANIEEGGVAFFAKLPLEDQTPVQIKLVAEGFQLSQEKEIVLNANKKISLLVKPKEVARQTPSTTASNEQVLSTEAPPSHSKSKSRSQENKQTPPDKIEEPPQQSISQPESPKMITVRCLTAGIEGIRVWFYDQAGERYEATTTSNSEDVVFKVPSAMIGQLTTIHFKRLSDNFTDTRDQKLSPGQPIEIPLSVQRE